MTMQHVYAVNTMRRVVPIATTSDVRPSDRTLPLGWRWATPDEVSASRQRGADADLAGQCLPIYDEATGLRSPRQMAQLLGVQVRSGQHRPPWGKQPVDVDAELDGLDLDDPAWLLWRVTWLHGFTDGNGRISRALAYAALLAQDGQLRAAHNRRADYYGKARLTVPERLERRRTEYVSKHMNGLHEAHRREDAGQMQARLDALRLWLSELAEDQKAGRASADDLP